MSPDNFLSQNRIRTDNYGGFNGTPTEKVSALVYLNKLRAWNPDTKDFDYITYRTPGFSSPGFNAATFAMSTTITQDTAMRAFYSALKTGDIDKVHAAVDRINAIRAINGMGEFQPQWSDFDIVAEGNSYNSQIARFLNTERVSFLESGNPTFSGSPIPWFDTVQAYDSLNSYVNS